METNQHLKLSPPELLGNYKHIELTEDELNEAILLAKQKKERLLEQQRLEEIAAENRKLLTSNRWSFEQTSGFMKYRAAKLFEGKFIWDEKNTPVYNLLCYYFSDDEQFESIGVAMGLKEPSLKKGIVLAGNFGVGKTWLLKLFGKNQRQTYYMRSAKQIANDFQALGEENTEQYLKLFENPVNDAEAMFQRYSGLCIDDMGAEDVKNHYGNRKNVIGDLIEQRYFNNIMGVYFHASTNLTVQQLENFYGGRVISRLREKVNLIELDGTDRRK